MDTTMYPTNTPTHTEPTVWPVNDSVWVTTFFNLTVGIVGPVWWNYTTDYGKTWTAPASLNIYHPWIAGVDITSHTYTSAPMRATPSSMFFRSAIRMTRRRSPPPSVPSI